MISVTKIFDFELGHAIHGYEGSCRNIHGHSYKLFVTVISKNQQQGFLASTGFVIDFKILKEIVHTLIVKKFDHQLVLSKDFLDVNPSLSELPNIIKWDVEPSAENILLYIKNILDENLPGDVLLQSLRLHETATSYAEWTR